jgi:hypothetical protein
MFKYEMENHRIAGKDVVIIRATTESSKSGFLFKATHDTWTGKWETEVLLNASGCFDADECADMIESEEIGRIRIPDYRHTLAYAVRHI